MLKFVDTQLLNAAQKSCDWFQLLTGLTKLRVEKWTVILQTFFWCLSVSLDITAFRSLLLLMMVGVTFSWARAIDVQEKEFFKNGRLYRRITESRGARVIGTIALIAQTIRSPFFTLENELLICSNLCLIAWIYVSVAIPRPPGKSKARQWYESGLWWLKDRLNDAPAPAPA